MGRTARDKRPHIPPVRKIELSARHTKLRLALAVLFFALGVGLIVFSLNEAMSVDAGWTQIEASASKASCADDFTFLYPLGTIASPTTERKALTTAYTSACVDAYRLFNGDSEFAGICNPRYLNAHPNEALPLDPALYRAFEQIADSGDRSLYLAPIYEIYDGIFHCDDPSQAVDFDPRQSEELRTWFAQVCDYANDPEQVNVELLGDNRAVLRVSDAYLAFAQMEEIGSFIDFYWMKNAFISDYIAERLHSGGYAMGTLSSCDGFMRNLDASCEAVYALSVLDRCGSAVLAAASLNYTGSRALVSLRTFPISEADAQRCAILSDGSVRTQYLSTADGLCRSAISNITAYSETATCAEILLQLIPIYVSDELDADALTALTQRGIESVYCDSGKILYTQKGLALTAIADGYTPEVLQS